MGRIQLGTSDLGSSNGDVLLDSGVLRKLELESLVLRRLRFRSLVGVKVRFSRSFWFKQSAR